MFLINVFKKRWLKWKITNNSSPDGCFFSGKYITKHSYAHMPPSAYINLVHESKKYQEL